MWNPEEIEFIRYIREECDADDYEKGDEIEDRDDVVGSCDYCSGTLHDYDNDCLAVVSADGTEAHVYCQYCARQMRFVEAVLGNAGLWYAKGYADVVTDSANEEVHKRSTIEQRLKKIRWAGPIHVERLHHGQRAF